MTDKELLELAAKAAGVELKWSRPYKILWDFSEVPDWNPLTDDGDALRLAVKLKMNVDIGDLYVDVAVFINDGCERLIATEYWNDGEDPYAATRRAIVRAAAETGRTLG